MTFDGAKRGICFLFVFSKKQPAVAGLAAPSTAGSFTESDIDDTSGR